MPGLEAQAADLEAASAEPGFWDDARTAQNTMRRLGDLRARVGEWSRLSRASDDLAALEELGDDPEMAAEIAAEAVPLAAAVAQLELDSTLGGPYDASDAILVVHAGEGGVDAQDWAQMLTRMYVRWAERRGLKAEILDTTDGEEAGIKNATVEIRGTRAYGYAKAERGSHRLVRLSPFDAAHRRHTAFALVEVLPELDGGDAAVEIRDDDVRMDTYRASGAGGQHVNKTSSAVRLTHVPTGVVVTCQNERSQIQNRESAMKILRARLLERRMKEEEAERSRLKGEHQGAGFGNRIRSYVLQPYTQVTDHRTDVSIGDAHAVLDGGIDPFIDAWLHQQLGADREA